MEEAREKKRTRLEERKKKRMGAATDSEKWRRQKESLHRELKRALEKYEKLGKLGEGSYGKVYKAKDKCTGQLVGLMETHIEETEACLPGEVLRYISSFQMLAKSPYIAGLLSVVPLYTSLGKPDPKPNLYLVFDYLDTDLKMFIKDSYPEGLPPALTRSFLFQLCKGVALCHLFDVLLGDLRPQHLLVDKEKRILMIADLEVGPAARAYTVPLKLYTRDAYPIMNKLVLSRIKPPRFGRIPKITPPRPTCGPLAASSPKWLQGKPCSPDM